MRIFAVFSYVIAMIFIGMGFHRIYAYENSEYFIEDNVNSWVGGDAYNYIINGTHATTFMILALIFVVVGLVMEILIKVEIHIQLLSKGLNLSVANGEEKEMPSEINNE